MIEGLAQQAVAVAERHQAAPEIAGGGDAEGLAEAPARSTVIGDRDHGGDGAGVAPHRLQRRRQTVAASESDDTWPAGTNGQRWMSRWCTIGSNPFSPMRRPS